MNKLVLAAIVMASVAMPVASSAQASSIASREAAAKAAPADGGAAIELANAYWLSGRQADAYDSYRRALSLGNVMLETRSGDAIWSHEVARKALAQRVTLTAR